MAGYLYGLGRWCFRHAKTVLALWLALLVAAGFAAASLSGTLTNSFSLPGTESTKAFSLIDERTGQKADGATARMVIQAPKTQTLKTASAKQDIEAAIAKIQAPDVLAVSNPYTTGTISKDGTTAYLQVNFTKKAGDLSSADLKALTKASDALKADGYVAHTGGDAVNPPIETGRGEIIGIAVALLVLLLTFGSLVAAGLPLLTAVIGVGSGLLAITAASGFVDLTSTTPALASMLGLAVGIDYALFIMSRFRHETNVGKSLEEATALAVGTAGSAVVFAGLTVIIALSGLSVVGIGFLTQMGLAAAFTVLMAVVIALTLLPALLGVAGRWVSRGRIIGLKQSDPEQAPQRSIGNRWVTFLGRHRIVAVGVGLLIAVVLAIPVAKLELAIPDDGTKPAASDARQAYDMISDKFGPGLNGPLLVVVDTQGAADPQAAVQSAVQTVMSVHGDVAAVIPPLTDPSNPQAAAAFKAQLDKTNIATITVVPKSNPSDVATKQLVSTLRSDLAPLHEKTGATPYVSGQTAVGVDVSQSLANAFPKYLLVVVGLAFILLAVVFRSILVPLKATLGFLLSVGISLGVSVAVFQWGWLQGLIGLDVTSPIVFILPILLTGILFGLAMDYEVFLVSRMREEHVHGAEAREAVVVGFSHSSRVVVAAAAIMTGVFAGFVTGNDYTIKAMAFALAIGVVADAFLVRMTIVPAVMMLVGERMWWLPKWLDKVLPNLDIEGESLADKLKPSQPPS